MIGVKESEDVTMLYYPSSMIVVLRPVTVMRRLGDDLEFGRCAFRKMIRGRAFFPELSVQPKFNRLLLTRFNVYGHSWFWELPGQQVRIQ